MLTTDGNRQLEDLLGTAIAQLDIPDDLYQLAVARYEDVGAWLSDYWTESPEDGIVYPQGSFLLGTVVQPVNPRDDYDIDVVCRRDIAKLSTTQADLKSDVGNGLGQYVASARSGRPRRHEGKRCWTLEYPDDPFHLDILPAIPDAEAVPNGILLTDQQLREWQRSNPLGYAAWFRQTAREEFISLRAAMAKQLDVAEVPDWKVKTTLQRTVQALKRHRDIYFGDRPSDKPASIIITTLAARAYAGGTLYDVLVDVTGKMPHLVNKRDGVFWVANPVQEKENFADRWRAHPNQPERFFVWMEKARSDFAGFGSELGVDRILEKVGNSLGEAPAAHAGEALGSRLARDREAGELGMAAGTGLLGSATRRPIPKHTFHGGGRTP